MKYIAVLTFLVFLAKYHVNAQIDTLQTHDLGNGQAYVIQENGLKKILFKKVKESPVLIYTERFNENNSISPGSTLDRLIGIESSDDLVGILTMTKGVALYHLYDIKEGKRVMKNTYPFFPNKEKLVKYRLLDCFTIMEDYIVFDENDAIMIFNEKGDMQTFKSDGNGRVPNDKYHNLIRFKE